MVKQTTLRKLISLGMIAARAVFFPLKSPYFLTASNLTAIVRDSAVAGIVGVGLTYVIAVRDSAGSIQSVQMRASSFTVLGGGIGGLYWVVLAMVLLTVLGQFVLKKTRFGTNLYAVGSNFKAAQLSGINTDRTRMGAFVITGLLAAVGGVFSVARLQSTTVLLGDSFNFDPIAAAVIGGCALDGGSGDVVGTFLGAVFMAALDNGILKLQLSTAYQYVIKGIIIILVVIFDAWYRGFMQNRAQKKKAVKEATV